MFLIDRKDLKKLPALSIRSLNKAFLYPEPVLIRCDFEKSFKEQVRWSALSGQKPASQEQPTEHISRKSLSPETRYLMIEKECLDIKWVLDSLRY